MRPREGRTVALALLGNFLLLAGYYVLRPLRDLMATELGTARLQWLFTGTLLLTLACAPLFAWLTARFRLSRVLPGLFWFWLGNILVFHLLFAHWRASATLATAYYWWFSVVNLFMVSVYWSLMVDLFTARQAPRVLALVAAAGSTGAIAGPLATRALVGALGVSGLLLVAGAAFALVALVVHMLVAEKQRLLAAHLEVQDEPLARGLGGSAWEGFRELLRSGYALRQALFMVLMTWVATVAYFLQTDLLTRAYSGEVARTVALADIDLVVNTCSALVLLLGLGRFVTRFGVAAALVASPLLMAAGFMAMALAPTLRMLQSLQVLRRVSQYAIARPSREICFTVVPHASRYKGKNVIDTVAYRFGDVSAAWVQQGLQAAGAGTAGVLGLGLVASAAWAWVAMGLGRRFEQLRAAHAPTHATTSR